MILIITQKIFVFFVIFLFEYFITTHSRRKPPLIQAVVHTTAGRYHEFMQLISRVAIDFGSYSIRIGTRNKNQPIYSTRSLLVREVVSGNILAYGDAAVDYILKPGQELVRPIKDGVIIDYKAAVSLLEHAFSQAPSWWHVFRPQVVVAESLQLSSAKSHALGGAVQAAGGGKVYMTSVPVLAALGAEIDPEKSVGHYIVDIGAGTTEAAVVTRGSVAVSSSLPIGGGAIAESVVEYVEEKHQVTLLPLTAVEILKNVGVAFRRDADESYEFYVNNNETGEARVLNITGNEVASAISTPLKKITGLIADVVKRTPTTLLSDVAKSGIVVTGGVGNLDHIDTYIKRELGIPVSVVQNPDQAVITGGQEALNFISMYEQSIPQ